MKYFKFRKRLVMNIITFSLLMAGLLVPYKVMASQERENLIYEEKQQNMAGGKNETDWDIFDSEATTTTSQITTSIPDVTTAHQHIYEETIIKSPTCKDTGIRSYSCTVEGCHASYTEKIPVTTGHTYQVQITKATPQKDGKEIKKCSICKKIQSTKIISRPKKITLSTTTYTYTGKEKKPSVKVFDANGNQISSSNYTIIYPSGRKNVGNYKVTVTFRGDKYQGSLSKSFIINQAAQVLRGSNCIKTLGDSAFSLNIKQEKGTGVLSYTSSDKTIATVSSKGKVTLKGVGTANITVTAAETKNYKKTSYKLTVTVKPKAIKLKTITNIKAGKMIATWEKNTKVTGYELQYSTKSNFSNMQKNTITSYKTTNKTISKLKKGKKYYVRVRCYQTIKGKRYYSNWSNVKSIAIKK